MLNVAVLMGRLVADPELRTTPNGVSVTSFTIAVDRDYVTAGQQRQADFIDVVAWRKTAEFIAKYFHKGSMIAVQGSIQTRSYDDKNGVRRKAVEVVADTVSFTGSKSDSNTGNYNTGNYNGGYNNNSGYNNNGYQNNNSYNNNSYNNNSYQNSSQPSTSPIYSSGSDNDFQDMSDLRDDDLPF